MGNEPVTARRFTIAAVAALTLLTSACAAGQIAQTADQKPTLDGTEVTVGNIDLRGLAIEAPTTTPFYAPGNDALIKLVIVNSGTTSDTLTGVSSSAFTGWSAYSSLADAQGVVATDQSGASSSASSASSPTGSTSVTLPPGSRVSWGVPDATGGLLLTKFKKPTYPGTTVRVTFTFTHAGSTTIDVPIALTKAAHTSVVPGPSATGQVG